MIVPDTHVLIWAVQNDTRLGMQARRTIDVAIRRRATLIPAICAWEIAFIDKAGRVPFPGGALAWIRNVLADPGCALAALEPAIAVDSVAMEWSHKDPADRIIVATARHLDCPLVTADRTILAHAAAGHLHAIDARA